MQHPYEHLSREQRIRRIGEILSKAVTLYVMKQRDAERDAGVAKVAARIQETESDRITRDIVEFLKRVGWASPREIRDHLDVIIIQREGGMEHAFRGREMRTRPRKERSWAQRQRYMGDWICTATMCSVR
jgi:hypothetical protein